MRLGCVPTRRSAKATAASASAGIADGVPPVAGSAPPLGVPEAPGSTAPAAAPAAAGLANHEIPWTDESVTEALTAAIEKESVKAYVVLEPGVTATEQELIDEARLRLARFKAPTSIDIVDRSS